MFAAVVNKEPPASDPEVSGGAEAGEDGGVSGSMPVGFGLSVSFSSASRTLVAVAYVSSTSVASPHSKTSYVSPPATRRRCALRIGSNMLAALCLCSTGTLARELSSATRLMAPDA